MKTKALRPHYLDASILVKLVITEKHSTEIKGYLNRPDCSWRATTEFCFAESLGVLKRKYKNEEISKKAYMSAVRRLISKIRNNSIKIVSDNFESHDIYSEAEGLVDKHDLDFVDAFQLVTVKHAWPMLGGASLPLFITADGPLYKVAEAEGIKVWYCRETNKPKC